MAKDDSYKEQVLKATYASINHTIDKTFSKQYAKEHDNAKRSDYNPNDFVRTSFATKAEYNFYVVYMETNGVEVIEAPRKIEGRYVCEIPKQVRRDDITDSEYLEKENKNSTSDYVSAQSLIDHFSQKTDTNVDGFVMRERIVLDSENPENNYYARQGNLASKAAYSLEGFDELYSDFNKIRNICETVIYTKKDIDKEINEIKEDAKTEKSRNDEIFKSGEVDFKPNQNEAVVKVTGIQADGTPNYSVILNGTILSETSDEYKNIMKMYDDRINKANDIVSKPVSIFNKSERVQNAHDVLDHSYEQHFALKGEKQPFDTTDVSKLAQALNLERAVDSDEAYRSYSNSGSRHTFSQVEKDTLHDIEKQGIFENKETQDFLNSLSGKSDFLLTLEQREKIMEDLSAAYNSFYHMTASEFNDVRSFLSGSSSAGGILNMAMSSSDVMWNNVSSALKHYSKQLPPAEKSLVYNFIKNRQELVTLEKELGQVNKALSGHLTAEKRSALETQRKNIEAKANRIKSHLDESKLNGILKNALKSAKDNVEIRSKLNDVIKKLSFSSLEETLRSSNLKFLQSLTLLDNNLASILGKKAVLPDAKLITFAELAEISKRFKEAALKQGLKIFNAKGLLDVNALRALPPSVKKMLGLDDTSAGIIEMLNGKNAFNIPKKQPNEVEKALMKKGALLAKGWNLLSRSLYKDEDLGNLLNMLYKTKQVYTGHHIKQVTAKIQKFQKIFHPSGTRKASRAGQALKNKLKSTNTYQKRVVRKTNKQIQKQGKKVAKYTKNVQKKATQKAVAKTTKKAAASAAKLAKTKAAAAAGGTGFGTVVASAAGVLLLLIAAVIIIYIILTTITSFLNRDPVFEQLAPSTPADTVAFKLYEDLREQERAWVSGLRDYETIYADKKYLLYTDDYLTLVEYANKGFGVALDTKLDINSAETATNDKIYVNPFTKYSFTSGDYLPEDYRTELDSFDGANQATIGTNDNIFSRTDISDAANNGYCISLNTGHTSNIKDIIAMTDVMYAMELDSMGNVNDDGLGDGNQGIMGCSPEQLNWQQFKDKRIGGIRLAWSRVKAWINKKLFGEDIADELKDPIDKYNHKELKYGAVNYTTISNYADTLFHASHQEHLYLDVDYFKTEDIHKGLTIGGKPIEQEDASKLGICTNPTHHKFYLAYDVQDNVVRPCIKGKNPTPDDNIWRYTLKGDESYGFFDVGSGSGCAVELGITRNLKNRETLDPDILSYDDVQDKVSAPCLDVSWGSNQQTYIAVEKQIAENGGNGCWEKSDPEETSLEGIQEVYETPTVNYGNGVYFENVRPERGYTDNQFPVETESDAKEYLGNVLLWSNKFYFTSGAWCGLFNLNESYCPDGLDVFEEIINNKLSSAGYTKNSSDGTWIKYELNAQKNEFVVSKVDTLTNRINQLGLDKNGLTIIDDIDNNLADWKADGDWGSNAKSGVYRRYKLTKKTVTTYKRICKGHNFVYCGGHIAVHNHGVVFSATDDQIAAAGLIDEEINPIADDDNTLNAGIHEGFSTLKGKYNDENFPTQEEIEAEWDLSDDLGKMNAVNVLSQSGGCETVFSDIYQGSQIGCQGLNLYNDGTEWKEGVSDERWYTTLDDGTTIPSAAAKQCRDIFDIDCMFLYGKNVFPLFADPSNYKGWNADNMTFVLGRLSVDWNDLYGFDIPLEMGDWFIPETDGTEDNPDGNGTKEAYKLDENDHLVKSSSTGSRGYSLSEQDIENIIDAVKAHYGSSFDKKREESIRRTLRWVGRGYDEGREVNYTDDLPHIESIFNKDRIGSDIAKWTSEGITTNFIQFEGSSTMGYSTSFVDYIRWLNGEDMDATGKMTHFGFDRTFTDPNNLLPADYIKHESSASLFSINEVSDSGDGEDMFGDAIPMLTDKFSAKHANMLKDYYCETQGAVFIGIIDEDLTLSTGQTLDAGARIIVDLNTQMDFVQKTKDAKGKPFIDGSIGNISIHGTIPQKFWSWDYKTVYWWLQNSDDACDSNTKFYRFKG